MARRLLLFLPVLLHLLLGAPRAVAAEARSVAPGEVRVGDLVVLGREAVVSGALRGTLVVVGGGATISGSVERNVVSLGGDVRLDPGAVVKGDLLVVGGRVAGADAVPPPVAGRLLTVGALEAAFAAELRTSPLSVRPASGLLLAFRLVLLLVWLALGLTLLRLAPRPVGATAASVAEQLTALAAIGAAAVLSALLVSAFLLLVLPASAGLLLAGLLVALLGVAKAFGLTAVFVAAGRRMTRRAARGSLLFGDPAALALGLALLGLVSFVPVAGPVLWSAASLVGIGAALASLPRGKRALAPF